MHFKLIKYILSLFVVAFQDYKEVELEDAVTLFTAPPNEECRKIRDMFYLTIAYASSLGGTGVITGTGTNLVFRAFMEQ